jgi:hypothetical protein
LGSREASVIESGIVKKTLPCLLLLTLGLGAYHARVRLIRAWLRPGPLRVATTQPAPKRGGPLAPVRVLLVDGLSARVSETLPAHNRLCASGLRLEVDSGFPTVSLPAQHVLWTGAWQVQSGVTFAVEKLPRRLLPSLPELVAARSRSAVALAEAHREIVSSFPFTFVSGPERGAGTTALSLQQIVLTAAQSHAPLVFVHTLAVDEAGHMHGSVSSRYEDAARRSDEILALLMAVQREDWTLLAMADHGHLPRGGHGDVEDEVRFTRACLAGRGIPAGRRLAVGLPDLTAILAERLGVEVPAASASRHSLAALLGGAGPTRPPPPALGPRRLVLALAALALLAAAFLWLGRSLPRPRRRLLLLLLPWSILAATVLLVCLGPPSLSCAFVYPAVSPVLLAVGAAAGALAALQLTTARSLGASAGVAASLLAAGLLAPTLAALLIGGWPLLQPPLVPIWSGWASSLLGACSTALPVLGVALALDRRP